MLSPLGHCNPVRHESRIMVSASVVNFYGGIVETKDLPRSCWSQALWAAHEALGGHTAFAQVTAGLLTSDRG